MFALTLAAADLKTVAPEQFARLVDAFAQIEAKLGKDYLAAEANVIFGAQGKAWLIGQLRARLENCYDQKRLIEKRV